MMGGSRSFKGGGGDGGYSETDILQRPCMMYWMIHC